MALPFADLSSPGAMPPLTPGAEERTAAREQALAQRTRCAGERLLQLRRELQALASQSPAQCPADWAVLQEGMQASMAGMRTIADEEERAREARAQALAARAEICADIDALLQNVEATVDDSMQRARLALAAMQAQRSALAEQARAATTTRPPSLPVPDEAGDLVHRTITAQLEGSFGTNFYTGFDGVLVDGGVFVETARLLALGAQVRVQVIMPDGSIMGVDGCVHWLREWDPSNPRINPGMGIRFVSLGQETAKRVCQFVATHDALFYTE